MKNIKTTLILFIFLIFSNNIMADKRNSIYDFKITDIDGNVVNFSTFKGKPLLLVNTASRCGFTPQYEGLQNIFVKYRLTDLTIIAVTSNSFNQEYEDAEQIKKICLVNYGVSFITSSPMNVKGENTHPIYAWIREEYNKKD